MTLSANISKLQSEFKSAMQAYQKINEESRAAQNPDEYKKINKKKVAEKFKENMNELREERKQLFYEDVAHAQEKLNNYYQKERAGRDSYHFLRAERILQAKDLDEAKTIYRRQLDRMTPEERQKHRFSYDDALSELQAKVAPEAGPLVEDVINEYRSGIELAHLTSAKVAQEVYNQLPALENFINMSIEDVLEGEEPPKLNFAEVVNDIKDNARKNIAGQAEADKQANPVQSEVDQLVDGNPYFEGDQARGGGQ